MLSVHIPKDRKKLERQAKALECLLNQDTDEESRNIHRQALDACKQALNAFEGI